MMTHRLSLGFLIVLVACGGESQTTMDASADALPDNTTPPLDAQADAKIDASFDSGLDASTLPAIPGALVWLEGDLGVKPGAVAQWKDQSSFGNDATQSDLPSQPLSVLNGLNGRPVVRFDGTRYLSLPGGFADFTQGLSAFVVTKPAVTAHPANLAARFFDFAANYGTLTSSILFVRYWPNGQDVLMYQVYPGSSPGPNVGAASAITDDAWQELSVVEAGGNAGTTAQATLYKNGALVASSAVLVPDNLTRQSNLIGKSNVGADPLFKGDFAALIVFQRALTPTERQTMDDYLKKKWAF